MVNGQTSGFKLKRIASYVMQEDALHAALTVRTLVYRGLRVHGSCTVKGFINTEVPAGRPHKQPLPAYILCVRLLSDSMISE